MMQRLKMRQLMLDAINAEPARARVVRGTCIAGLATVTSISAIGVRAPIASSAPSFKYANVASVAEARKNASQHRKLLFDERRAHIRQADARAQFVQSGH